MGAALLRIRHEWRDLVEVVLLPSLAAVLPWRLAFNLFRHFSRWEWLYREPQRRALDAARMRGWADQPGQWLRDRKLTTLIDHADHYLCRTRSNRWMDHHLQVDGQWPPASGAALALTFHWGGGMWAMRHAGRGGIRGHMLVAPLESEHFRGHSVLHRYIKSRMRTVAKTMHRPFIDVSQGMAPILAALDAQEHVHAVIDVPADQVNTSQPIEILGLQARVPTTLLRVAVERAIPVCVYVGGTNMETGRRFLRITQLGTPADLDQLVRQVFAELERAIREAPAAWHLWGEAQRFFRL